LGELGGLPHDNAGSVPPDGPFASAPTIHRAPVSVWGEINDAERMGQRLLNFLAPLLTAPFLDVGPMTDVTFPGGLAVSIIDGAVLCAKAVKVGHSDGLIFHRMLMAFVRAPYLLLVPLKEAPAGTAYDAATIVC
jgi:hypothetical protein